jgi:hypothetical protein
MTYPPRGMLWTFREGRVIRFEWFVDPEQDVRAPRAAEVRPLKSARY